MRFLCFSLMMIGVLGLTPALQAQPVMLEAKPLLAEPDVKTPTPAATENPVAPVLKGRAAAAAGKKSAAAAKPLPDLKPDAVLDPDVGYVPPEKLINDGESVVSPSAEPWQKTEPRRRKGQTAEQIFAKLPIEIQNQILEETQLVHRECTQYKVYSQFHDCECMGSTYFEERVFSPADTKDTIVGRISGKCVSLPGAAAYGYDQCYAGMRFVLVPERMEDYCNCFGNQFGKEYQQSPYPDFDNIRSISKRTNTFCLKNVPAAIKSLNP